MPKRRTKDTTANVIADAGEKPKGQKYSELLVTINPNRAFPTRESPGFSEMTRRLEFLGDYLLGKKNIIRTLKFGKDGNSELNGVVVPREEHIAAIDEIDPERTASVEWNGSKAGMKRIHLHLTYYIKHRTFLQVDRTVLERVVSTVLKMPANEKGSYPFHINIKANGSPAFKQYVKKFEG